MANEKTKEELPVVHAEDVEFNQELADADDLEAQKRARAADRREES
jgi:hypothetical protein